MDRLTVRSFRAQDLAERALKDLARSRIDTTRDVVFQALGPRYFEAREDAARIAHLFREDAFHAPEGHFARLTLRVDRQLAERLAALEPRAAEARLEEAARNAIIRELPRAQGVYLARFEPSDRGGLEPIVHAHLSSREAGGGPAQAITREGAQRFEAGWNREVERAFGLTRTIEQQRGREVGVNPDAARLREQWDRASLRLFGVYSERLAGRATQQDLLDAAAQARAARAEWSRAAGPRVNVRGIDDRAEFDVIRLRIEGGNRYLRGPLEAQRRALLETAAARAAGLPDGPDKRLAVVEWPAGRDLHAAIYFNQRSQPERTPDGIEPERLRATLEAGLRDEIQRLAPSIDPAAEARAEELGRIQALVVDQAARRRAVVPPRPREVEPTPPAAATIVVALDRETGSRVEASLDRAASQQTTDRLQPAERDWSRERVFGVRLRVPTGAEQLERMGLNGDEAARAVQRAVDRAYPFLEREGIRNNFLWSIHGRALDVQVAVPEKLGWTADQLSSPQFQQRFITGFHQALAQIGPTRMGPDRQPMLPGFARDAFRVGRAPMILRQAEQDPERAARNVVRAVFDKLSDALPKPFRLARDLGRTISRFVPRGE